MKKHSYIIVALAALALFSCIREELPEQDQTGEDVEVEGGTTTDPEQDPEEEIIPGTDPQPDPDPEAAPEVPIEIVKGVDGTISITAGFENQRNVNGTKTHVTGGYNISWGSGDNAIYVFDSKGAKNKFTSTESGVSTSRTFTGTISSGSQIAYILWTGKGKDETDNSEMKTVPGGSAGGETITPGNGGAVVDWDQNQTKAGAFFATQYFVGSTLEVVNPQNISNTNSFANKANIAIYRSGDSTLKNVFGYIRFTVPKGDDGNAAIKKVEFTSDNDMAGKIKIDYTGDEPVTTILSNGSKTVTVNTRWNPSTSRYEDGTLFAILPPGTYKNLKIKITPFKDGASTEDAATGEAFELTSTRDVVIKRGQYTDCGILPAKYDPKSVLGQTVQVLTGSVGGLCVEGNVLYAGANSKVYVYDISIPMEPKLTSTLSLYGNARQITLYNNKLYVTARETGLWVFDAAKPLQPSFLRRYDTIELATGIDAAGNGLFVGQRNNGVEFIDISTPSSPQHIRIIPTDESQSVFYRDGYLYSGEWSSGKITIFNAKDLDNIIKLKTIDLQGYGDGLWISGNRLYASTGHHHRNHAAKTQDGDGHGMEIWDVSSPENPTFISRIEFDVFYKSGTDCWLPRPSGDGKTVFCGDVFNGMYVVDVTDEYAPEIIEHWQPASNTPDNKKVAVSSVALGNGVVYVATTGDGLVAIKCEKALPCTRDRGVSPTNWKARYNYTTTTSRYATWKPSARGAVHAVAAWKDAFFVACGDAGLSVIKVDRSSGKANPSTHSTLNLEFAGGVAVRGNRLYVAQGEEGIGVYSIADGPVLTRIATIKEELSSKDTQRYSCWVSAPNDNYVVNANRYGGYQFIAVGGTEQKPTFTYRNSKSQNLNYAKYISEEVCKGNLLPYATRDGLFWIDLSSKNSAPVSDMISGIKSEIVGGVTNFKNGSALITRDKNLLIVESGATTISSTVGTNDNYKGIPRWDGGNYVLLTNHIGQKFSKLDMSSTSSPRVLHSETVKCNPEPGIIVDGKAYVPCGYQGLLIEN